MPIYVIEAVKTIYLETQIEANSEDEAYELERENEYTIDDYEEVGTDFRITNILEWSN